MQNHFVAVYESGAGSVVDGPLAGISSFFSNLFNRGAGGAKNDTDLLDSLVETDLKYTFIRTPSTEGIDDYSPSTSNLVIAAEGASDASGKVNNLAPENLSLLINVGLSYPLTYFRIHRV